MFIYLRWVLILDNETIETQTRLDNAKEFDVEHNTCLVHFGVCLKVCKEIYTMVFISKTTFYSFEMSHQRIDYEIIKTNVYLVMGDEKGRGGGPNLSNPSDVSILKDFIKF